VGFMLNLSFTGFVARNRDGKLNLALRVALASDETEEMDEEREERDRSDTIDSGDEAVEVELASDDRLAEK
jgi:hypothetical protein